jgi:hypothetical protein
VNAENTRILALPDRVPVDGDLTTTYARSGEQRLRWIQNQALVEAARNNGLLGPIGVGLGKALISFLVPSVVAAQRPVLLVPASVYDQTLSMYQDASVHWYLPLITIITYSMLSTRNGSRMLQDARPDLIVADEAHYLRSVTSARTRRVMRYMKEHPDTMFVALSGTITTRSILDYAHLAEAALRDKSPLPRDRHTLEAWSRVLDVDKEPTVTDGMNCPFQLPPPVARHEFQKIFTRVSGIVCSSDSGVNASLRIIKTTTPWYSEEVYNETWKTKCRPDGAFFEDDLSEWRTLRQLSLGYYYHWVWPNGEDFEWVEARNRWAKAVRNELLIHAHEGYDSPLLVSMALERVPVSGELAQAWAGWKAVKERPGPLTKAIWVERDTLYGVLPFDGILWYESAAIADALEEQGVRVRRAGEDPIRDGKPVALSMTSHGIGWNLQMYNRMMVLEPPSNGQRWEQVIGRCHRQGQEADTVFCYVLHHTEVYRSALTKAGADARYIEQTTGIAQRLCYADWAKGEE